MLLTDARGDIASIDQVLMSTILALKIGSYEALETPDRATPRTCHEARDIIRVQGKHLELLIAECLDFRCYKVTFALKVELAIDQALTMLLGVIRRSQNHCTSITKCS